MVTRAFELWELSTEEQLSMLGLSITNRAALTRYRNGEPLGANRDLLERAGYILSIHKSLRLIFPHDREVAYAWMSRRNRAFKGSSPAEVVSSWGFTGLLMVRAYLDRQRGN